MNDIVAQEFGLSEDSDLGVLLKLRFPIPLGVVDQPRWALLYVVSAAEARGSKQPPLADPDRVAAAFVAREAANGWRLVGGTAPGDATEQRRAFESLISALARHLTRRARDRAVNRRELASSDEDERIGTSTSRPYPGQPWTSSNETKWGGDPAETVVAQMHVFRELRRLEKILTSEPQRRFLAALARRPDLWDSIGVYGESAYVAEEVGLNPGQARQILKRIRAALAPDADRPDAA